MVKQVQLFRIAMIAAIAAAGLGTGSTNAWAQGATSAPMSKVMVSQEVAKRTLLKNVINADTTRAIVDACVEWQKAQPGNGSVAVFVLSPTGQIVRLRVRQAVRPR